MTEIGAKAEKGFTLVELAVAMIIIGLLVGGVLKGQEMIETARINRLIKQVNEISAANDTFYDQFKTKAGDMVNAETRIKGCAPPDCADGDGNGVIASDGTDNHTWASNVIASGFGLESIQFWKHLALMDIVTGVIPDADPDLPAYGYTHMKSPLGGGYEMYYDAAMTVGGGNQHTAMHVLRLNGDINGGQNGIVSTVAGQMIDTKMDDGDPNMGLVFADYGATDNRCKNPGPNGGRDSVYNTPDPNEYCTMFFKMFNR